MKVLHEVPYFVRDACKHNNIVTKGIYQLKDQVEFGRVQECELKGGTQFEEQFTTMSSS